jgi:hypothetical protein
VKQHRMKEEQRKERKSRNSKGQAGDRKHEDVRGK